MGAYDSEAAILTPSTLLTLIMKKGICSEPSSARMNWMVFFGQESSLNWDLMPQSGCLDAILQTKNHMKTTAAHNVHHKVNHRQLGGTFAATFGKLATWVSEMERMKLAWAAGPGHSAKASMDMPYASSRPTTQTSQPAQRPKPSTANINPTLRAAVTSLAQERHSYMTLNLNCGSGNPLEKNSLFLLT